MKFNIIAIGKCKDKSLISLYQDYIKRLKPHCPTTIIELAHGKGTAEEIKKSEAEKILAKINPNNVVIALDEKGENLGTVKLAQKIKQKTLDGRSDFSFIIGGAEGLDESIRKRADLILSLSALTYPHMLVRVILTEQLYRITMVNNNHPYHREG